MITRRSAIVGGLSATVVAAAGAAATARHGSLGAIRLVTSASAPAVRPAAAPAPTSPPARTRIEQPTTATVAADPVDSPLRVDWIGGSDVALEGVSLPDAFVRRVASVGGRPLAMRTRIRQGVMPIGVREMVEEAVAAGTEAIVMSLNLDWLYWDGVACDELTVPHER